MRIVILIVAVSLLASCAQQEGMEALSASTQYQTQALEMAKTTQAVIVNAYDGELRLAYRKHLDAILQFELEKATLTDGNVPRATVDALIKARDEQLDKIAADLDRKKAEFLRNPSLDAATRLNGIIGKWVTTYIDDFALRITQIIDEGKTIFDPNSIPNPEGEPQP